MFVTIVPQSTPIMPLWVKGWNKQFRLPTVIWENGRGDTML